jgi:hypothetical protein
VVRRGFRPDAAASAYLHARVADIVLGLIDERLGLFLRLHVGADAGLQILDQFGLFGLFQPGLDLGIISLLLLLVLHLAEQELSFELFAWEFLYELHQAGFRLHEGLQPGVYFRVDFELTGQLFLLFW